MSDSRFRFHEPAHTDRFPLSEQTSETGIPLFQPGAINLWTMIPCPLKPRFFQEFQNFSTAFNQTAEVPVYCPTVLGLDHDEIDDILARTEAVNDLPEVLVATGFQWIHSDHFRSRFIEPGVYQSWTPWTEGGPRTEWTGSQGPVRLDHLALGGWGVLVDQSVPGDELPRSWADLAHPKWQGQVAFHGCDGNPGYRILLKYIEEQTGASGLDQFCRNLQPVKHFSQILKAMDSADPTRPRFAILPLPAAVQVPSTKRAALVELRDGFFSLPVTVLVRRDRAEAARPLLPFFATPAFRTILARGGLVFGDDSEASNPYAFVRHETLLDQGYDAVADQMLQRFQEIRGLVPA